MSIMHEHAGEKSWVAHQRSIQFTACANVEGLTLRPGKPEEAPRSHHLAQIYDGC